MVEIAHQDIRQSPDNGRVLRRWYVDERTKSNQSTTSTSESQPGASKDKLNLRGVRARKAGAVAAAGATLLGLGVGSGIMAFGNTEPSATTMEKGQSSSYEYPPAGIETDAKTIPQDYLDFSKQAYDASRVLSLDSIDTQEAAATANMTPEEFIMKRVRHTSDRKEDGSYPKGRAEITMRIATAGMIRAAYEEPTGLHKYGEVSEVGIAEQDVIAYIRSLEDAKSMADEAEVAAGLDFIYDTHGYEYVYGQAEDIIKKLVETGHEIPLVESKT